MQNLTEMFMAVNIEMCDEAGKNSLETKYI